MQRLSIIALNGRGTLFAHYRDELLGIISDAVANGDFHPAAKLVRLPRRICRNIARGTGGYRRHDLRGNVWQIGPCTLNPNFNH